MEMKKAMATDKENLKNIVEEEVAAKNRKVISKFKKSSARACDNGEGEEADVNAMMQGEMLLTPPDHEGDGDEASVQEAEEVDDFEIEEIKKHKKQSGEMLVFVRYYNKKQEWIHIAYALHDAEEIVREYAKKKQLKGDVWKAGTEQGKRILTAVGIRGDGKHQELSVIWDNAFVNGFHVLKYTN